MSFASRSLRACSSTSGQNLQRYISSSTVSSNAASTPQTLSSSSVISTPSITASLLLSRTPLLTKTPQPLEKAYHNHSSRLEHSLSNPTPTSFYFKPGSLPLRRFQITNHQLETSYYGERYSGKTPDVGDINMETELTDVKSRDEWVLKDTERGLKSLEREPEDEVFCLVENREGQWGFPGVSVEKGEGLDEAVKKRIVGVLGSLGGEGMDTWLLTRKPIGVLALGEVRNFFLRSHILAGEPTLSEDSPYKSWAWLTRAEIEEKLVAQGDEKVWQNVKGMFGVAEDEDTL